MDVLVMRCAWTEDEDGTYQTNCGQAFQFIDGTPDENLMKFCCYCGQPLVVVRYTEPVLDDEVNG